MSLGGKCRPGQPAHLRKHARPDLKIAPNRELGWSGGPFGWRCPQITGRTGTGFEEYKQNDVLSFPRSERSASPSTPNLGSALTFLNRLDHLAGETRPADPVLLDILGTVGSFTGWPIGHIYRADDSGGKLKSSMLWLIDPEHPRRSSCFERAERKDGL